MRWLGRLTSLLPLLGLTLLLAVPASGLRVAREPWGSCTGGSVVEACAVPGPVSIEDGLEVLAGAERANVRALTGALRRWPHCRVSLPAGVVPSSFLVRTADSRLRPTVRRVGWAGVAVSGGWVVGRCR